MRSILALAFLFATAPAALAEPSPGDRIWRTGGGRPMLVDSIVADHYDKVEYKKGANTLSVPGNKVRTVDYGDTPEAFDLALDKRDAGEFENAITLFKAAQAEKVGPWIQVRAPFEIAVTYNRWGKYDEAVKAFDAVLAAEERTRLRPEVLFGRAQAKLGLGNLDGALADLDQLAKEAYENKYGVRWELNAALEKARMLDTAGRADEAKREFSKLETNAKANVGMTDLEADEKAMAQEMVGLARLAQGRVLIRDGKAAEAERFFSAIVADAAEAPAVRASAMVGQGEALQAQKELKKAQLLFAQVRILYGGGASRDACAEATFRLAEVAEALGEAEPRGGQMAQDYLLEAAQRYSDTNWGREAQKRLR
jgi:tetratricopeptide (TPR) repeat protein